MADASGDFPPRPADVGEWEDVLLRYELGPRALRHALEDLAAAAAAPGRALLDALAARAAAELWAARVLDAMQHGAPVPAEAERPAATPEPGPDPLRAGYEAYAAARAANFARLQRRGLEVWDWAAVLAQGRTITAYQLVREGLRLDAALLAAVRAAARGA